MTSGTNHLDIDDLHTIDEIAARRSARGERVARASTGGLWIKTHRHVCERLPPHQLQTVSYAEVVRVARETRTVALTYAQEPSEQLPANSVSYECQGPYDIDRLSTKTRRNIRRGLRHYQVGTIEPDDLGAAGLRSSNDTAQRLGHPPMDVAHHTSWMNRMSVAGYTLWVSKGDDGAVGAWIAVLPVDDWALISMTRSGDTDRRFNVTNALLFTVLDHYLNRGIKTVTYGLGSVKVNSKKDTLDWFKTSMGFEHRPIHRRVRFAIPIESALQNALARRTVAAALRRRPQSRLLGQAAGLLAIEAESPTP